MAANPQQSPVLSARPSKKNVFEVNAKLFKTLERTFQDASPANYEKFQSDTRKLAKYLSDQRGYYESARPEIVKLIATVHRSLSREQGVDSLSMLPSPVLQSHPIGTCLAQLMAAIRPHVHLFVDQGQRAFINSSLRLVGLEPLSTPGTSSAGPSRNPSHDATTAVTSPNLPAGQQLAAPRPLSFGSISVPVSIASNLRPTRAPYTNQATNAVLQPVSTPAIAASVSPAPTSTRPQEQLLVSRSQAAQVNGPPLTATSLSAGLSASPSIPAAADAAAPVSGVQNTSGAKLPPSRSASLSQAASMSASSGPRPKKKKKTLDFATLFQIDIAGTQRQGSVSTSTSATPVVVKKEEVVSASFSEQMVQNASPAMPSPAAQSSRAASTAPGAMNVEQSALREGSVPEQTKHPKARLQSVGAPAQDDTDVQIIHHTVPSASPSVGGPVQEVTVKVEEVSPTPLRLAESPQPIHAEGTSTQPAHIPDVSIHQETIPEVGLTEQASTLEGASIEAVPPPLDDPLKGLSEPPLAEKEHDVPPHQDEQAMDIDLPSASIPPPPVSHLQPPVMIRAISTASTSVSMDLESVSDYQAAQPVNDRGSMPTSGLVEGEPSIQGRDSLQEPAGVLPQGDTNQTIQEDTLPPTIEDAMDLDQLSVQVPQPSPSLSPAPSDGLFEDDLRPVSYKAGTPPGTRVILDFHLSPEDANLTQRWWAQTGSLSEIRKETLCLSLGCYPADQVDYSQPLKPQIRSKPPQWPQGGGLGINFDTSAPSITLPLAPPFTVTPENTFDVSSLAKAGHNAFEIVQSKDWSQHFFALFLHRPTRSQVDKIKKKRKADEDWEKWKAEMARPLALNIPKPPWVLST